MAGFAFSAPHPAESEAPSGSARADQADRELPAGDPPTDANQVSRDVLVACAHEPQNDTGNGQRLLHWFGSDIVHVRDMGWHFWTGTHWEGEGGDEVVMRHAQTVAARILLEADVIAATPNEQRAIDNASDARDAMRAIEKDKPGGKAKLDQRWQMLSRVVEAGKAAQASVKARQIARRKYSISSGNKGKVVNMYEFGGSALHQDDRRAQL